MTLLPLAAQVTAAFVALHLAAERRGAGALRAVGKLGASAAFVALAIALRPDGRLGWTIVAALLLSAAGDGLLLSSGRAAFLAGLGAFLAAHVAYAIAFASVARPPAAAVALVGVATAAALVWLWPHAGELRPPVVAYCVAIAAMVSFALGVDRPEVRAGAVLFWVSDLTVARDRFVQPGFVNRAIGLPLYYAAQLLLATAVR